MYKTSVYTLVNSNIEELAHWKQQKSQKVILSASHWLCVDVLLNTVMQIDHHSTELQKKQKWCLFYETPCRYGSDLHS